MQTRTFQTVRIIGLAIVLAETSGCSREPSQLKATYTVEQYLAKPDVMEAKLRECANNPGELRNDPDCINVKAAALQHGVDARKHMEPLKFPTPEEMNASTKPADRK